jgi:hypothetical protein
MATRSASFDAIILRSKEVPSGARVATLLSAEEGIVEAFVFGGGKSKLRSLASTDRKQMDCMYRFPSRFPDTSWCRVAQCPRPGSVP